MPGDTDLAALGAVLAERARSRILLALGDGRALPASVLASEAGVAPSTASGHLSRLVGAGLLNVTVQGRHRYYRLAGPEVGELIEVVSRLAPAAPIRSLREDTRAHAVRTARTCYDHVAGRLGVAIMHSLIADGSVTGGDGIHHVDGGGQDRLSARGRDVDYRLSEHGADAAASASAWTSATRARLRYCVDWSEQAHHLSGAVGRAPGRPPAGPRLGAPRRPLARAAHHPGRRAGLRRRVRGDARVGSASDAVSHHRGARRRDRPDGRPPAGQRTRPRAAGRAERDDRHPRRRARRGRSCSPAAPGSSPPGSISRRSRATHRPRAGGWSTASTGWC